MNVELTKSQIGEIVADAKQEVVSRLLTEKREDLDLLTPAQVCGILDVNSKTLDTLGIPRVTVVPGRVYRYRSSVVQQWIKENEA